MSSDALRALPRVDTLLEAADLARFPRSLAREAVREVLDEARVTIRGGGAAPTDLVVRVAARLRTWLDLDLRSVINATGIVVHTNLGRAPWAREAVEAVGEIASGYCDLELELETGLRGGRHQGVTDKLCRLTGAEAALVVNNCAAAVLLTLTALAYGREVIVSRGQLVEIGGSFRVPDVISSGGARLREVGTTNRTRPADVERAIGPETAVLMTVHPSNFRLEGFVRPLMPDELVPIAREHGLLVVADVGSGDIHGERGEWGVRGLLASGVDIVCFSGDKLLGGPQAGILVGAAEPLGRLRAHPMYRALRVGKGTSAALEATLALHLRGEATPVAGMVDLPLEVLRSRAEALLERLRSLGCTARLVEGHGFVGGGARPGEELASVLVELNVRRPHDAAAHLRRGRPAVMCRVGGGAVLLDLRTVPEELESSLLARLAELARLE